MKKIILSVTLAWLVLSCATSQKIKRLEEEQMTAGLIIPEEQELPDIEEEQQDDTLAVESRPEEEFIIMNAIKDENGEMVATDVIKPAKVTARFKNVAERNGKVVIAFDITIDKKMVDAKWQLRLHPRMRILGKTEMLDSILITGSDYRKAQMKGYQQYERFLQSIISDSTKFIQEDQLEIFIQRNLPEIYRFKTDSSVVSDQEFTSYYGVTQQQAVDHYTNQYRIRLNARKISRKEKMYRKYVKVPLIRDGLKLDTVLNDRTNSIVYRYTQTIETKPGLKKAEIVLSGAIYEEDEKIYEMPETRPITFYISSLTNFIDHSDHYLTEVIYRKAEVNTACYIDFNSGKHDIDTSLGHNAEELSRIEKNLRDIAENNKYDLDSIIIHASCSPEGRYSYNQRLSERRANSISHHIDRKLKGIYDSILFSKGVMYDMEGHVIQPDKTPEVKMIYRNNAENWTMLDQLVGSDKELNQEQKDTYFQFSSIKDPDQRESLLKAQNFYQHLRQKMYPRVRTVLFNFYLHRKNMVKDTVHTTTIDTIYLQGVRALEDRDYETAIKLLRPYADFNTALAYCAMDYNNSALDILEKLNPDNKIKYLLAILYSRLGEEKKAVRYYQEVCESDRSYINRGNLDPEISSLIRKYRLDHNF